jgi:LysM domain
MNLSRAAILVCGAGLFGFISVPSALASNLEQEYDQVKKIAMKDPGVRAAFARAHEKLNRRILEIDPSLKPFVEAKGVKKKPGQSVGTSSQTISRSLASGVHIVAKGETLTSLARRYKVSVNSLVKANNLSKEGTLQVGQRLAIPSTPR